MKIITISREFGSGGRELGKRLADIMGFDYYDSEILYAVSKNSGLDAHYIANKLDGHGWQDFPVTFCKTINSTNYMQSSKVSLLIHQKKVIEEIALLGKDCIIVGRNADVILEKYDPFHIFVCADTDAKVKRCMKRAQQGEILTEKELVRKMKQIDKMRSQTREIFSGLPWGQKGAYHLIVNTSSWDMKDLAPAVADFACNWFMRRVSCEFNYQTISLTAD